MKRFALMSFLIAATSLALTACDSDDTPPNTTPGAGEAFSIPFSAVFGDADFESGVCVDGVGNNDASIAFYDLRFYVSDVEAEDADGEWVPLAQEALGWQDERVTLIDLADSDEGGGTAGMNNHIRGTLPDGEYQRLRFIVGVPAELNHSNAAVATAPLNVGSMDWSWQAGRKFLRLDGKECGDAVEDAPASVSLHLGSTGCEGEIGDISSCTYENRAYVELDWKIGDSITLDLDSLLQESTLPASCMAEVRKADCGPLFAALGLAYESEDGLLSSVPQRAFYASDALVEPHTTDAGGDDGMDDHHH